MTLTASVPVEPLTVSDVIVPLDESAYSHIALKPASALARHLRARVCIVGVAADQDEAGRLEAQLHATIDRLKASVEARVGEDAPAGVLQLLDEHPDSIACMASHARGRIGGAVFGSFAGDLLRLARRPVMLVGPSWDPDRPAFEGPVIACVDGSPASERALPVAAAWAATLGQPLVVATVVEPVLPPFDGHPAHRRHGPDHDPEGYVRAIAEGWAGRGVEVSGVAVYDPISPAEGVAAYLDHAPGTLPEQHRPASLLVVTTAGRTGLARAVMGSDAAAILHASAVPVVVVPLDGE